MKMNPGMKVWTTELDYVIAPSIEVAARLIRQVMDDDLAIQDLRQVPDDEELELHFNTFEDCGDPTDMPERFGIVLDSDEDGFFKPVTKTAGQWIRPLGYGYLASARNGDAHPGWLEAVAWVQSRSN